MYYTPQYIVRYIVDNTIGIKIRGKTPEDIAKLKVVDPACGSGSFLVEAYQELLNYHLDYYSNEKERKAALKNGYIYEAGKNVYKLTIEEKQRILLNSIYGVDIDGQAVEVTKLSLYLKLLENEGSETQGQLFKFSDLTLLPSLDSNIKCGNSLVGSDYYNEKDLSLFDDEAMRKINTFDWDKEFPEVFAQGGFDCVIGNPPYLRVQGLREYYTEESKYYEQVYKSATGRFDFYILFMEKGFKLLNKDGVQSFILPNKFINSDFGSGIRQFIYENHALNSIVHFESHLVFNTASVYTCIIGLSHNNTDFKFIKTEPEKITDKLFFDILPFDILQDNGAWHLSASADTSLIQKLQLQKMMVKHIFKGIFQGIVSGDNKAFYLSDCNLKEEFIVGYNSLCRRFIYR
ncbi:MULTISPECIES: Eco57I restriction-modification methylase domain-containing protein [unclassified Treponema]|uniref:Eco57I restriction-modification methylase domain-containing protein n=1 Tax=unclassified Treponema TaxID=2638727 RepID=UPI0020A44560|nr:MULTISPECIES: DNA methyltransferase [unclassified Treponema]